MIHFELTLVDLPEVPRDCLWQAQRKSFMLHLAIKLGSHSSFQDEHTSPDMSVVLPYPSFPHKRLALLLPQDVVFTVCPGVNRINPFAHKSPIIQQSQLVSLGNPWCRMCHNLISGGTGNCWAHGTYRCGYHDCCYPAHEVRWPFGLRKGTVMGEYIRFVAFLRKTDICER